MKNKRNIHAVDLFCGVGGLSYGLEKAGITVTHGIDIDPVGRHALETNTSATFLHADVDQLKPKELAALYSADNIVLLAGCAPCQPFSTYSQTSRVSSKKGNSIKLDEWNLVRKFGELAVKTSPELITMENVPPLAKQSVFLELLDTLSKHYWLDWKLVQCTDVGLAQSRKRLVLVGSRLGPIQIPKFKRKGKTVRDVIGGLPEISAGGADKKDILHRSSKLSSVNLERIRSSKPGGTWRDWPHQLRADCHKQPSGATYPSVYGRMEWDKTSPTITTQCFGYGNGRFGHPQQDRAISLREAAMLQGFPKRYSFLPKNENISFATVGRLIGNAVPVNLGEAIGKVFQNHVSSFK